MAKKSYPKYAKGDTNHLEKNLGKEDKAVLKDFLTFVSSTTGDLKLRDRRKDILQIRDVIQKPFNDWEEKDIIEFCSILNKDSRKPETKKGILRSLQVFLKWKFSDWAARSFDVLKKLQKQLVTDNSDRYNSNTLPTPEEFDKMIRAADKLWYKLWIAMASDAGLPFAVQSGLKFSNVKVDEPQPGTSTLTYFRFKNKNGFVFPLGKVATYYLKQWLQEYPFQNQRPDDLIFPSPQDRSKPLSQNSVYTMLNRIAKVAGIEKHFSQYLIRHSVLNDGYSKMPEETHRKIFGHKPGSRMTAKYSHQDDDKKTLKDAIAALHKVKVLTKEEKSELEELRAVVKEQGSKLATFKSEMANLREFIQSSIAKIKAK